MSNNRDDDDDKPRSMGITIEQINLTDRGPEAEPDPAGLLILPAKNLVLFPGVTISVALKRPMSEHTASDAEAERLPIGLVCQADADDEWPKVRDGLCKYGVLANVLKVIELPDGEKNALVIGRNPIYVNCASRKKPPRRGELMARVEILDDFLLDKDQRRFATLVKKIRKVGDKLVSAIEPAMAAMLNTFGAAGDSEALINHMATHLPFDMADKIRMLATRDLYKRATILLSLLMVREEEFEITRSIMEKAKVELSEDQRRAFMQRQMDVIYEELYGGADDFSDLMARAEAAQLPAHARVAFDREAGKLRRINPQNPDYYVTYTYLDTLLSLPWNQKSEGNKKFKEAAEVLDNDHYGLKKVKERILEQMAAVMHNPTGKSPIICLVGPPGVGKTSLGRSVARALGIEFERVSLGGLHDEAEIRGHRRTYIGAMPGRIIDALKRAGTSNPLIMLDEIDKVGADYKGDPSAALLEVLDPEQNCRFHDNYVDVDFDLSKVLFITTANTLSTVPRPLIDRMEVITLSGYLPQEKLEIAKRHLVPRALSEQRLEPSQLEISDAALMAIIDTYTSESGVRQLEKSIAAIARKRVLAEMNAEPFATPVQPEHLYGLLGLAPYSHDKYEGNDIPGVVTGLAWTEAGGETLLAEALLTDGKGKQTVTGNLGDVMKESVTIAYQWVKAHAAELGIDPAMFEKHDLHVHFPEGATPKDGPSAGIAIATAIASAFTGRKVRERVAMTGEITLRGRVLPVGGIKEKMLAAKRAGITDVVLSEDNRKDIADIDKAYVEGLTFHFVGTASEVMAYALV